MTHHVLSYDPSHRTIARVEEMPFHQPFYWLSAGWTDMLRAPAASIGYGLLFVAISYAITLIVMLNQLYFLLLPLLSGFFLVAPALGMGLYEMSRRLEKGESPTLGQALMAIVRLRFEVSTMGAFVTAVLLAWILVANLIFVGLSVGITPTPAYALDYLFSLGNLPMLAVGTLVGGVFALAIFALTAVAVPMLLDRPEVNVLSAMQVSVAACIYNWRPMLLWAALIVTGILIGFATLYLGLAILFPIIGHATWHAYRDLVHR
jgi:uncharacterized membrane protein